MPNTKTNALSAINETVTTGCTYTEIKSIKAIHQDFAEKMQNKHGKEGANNYLNEFMQVAEIISFNFQHQSFSYIDFCSHSVFLEIPPDELRFYYNSYITMLQGCGRIKTTFGIYDYPVHLYN